MITKSIKTSEGKISLNIPVTLDELTVGQLRDLQKDDLSDAEAVAILSHCPLDTIYNIRNIDDLIEFKEPVMKLVYEIGATYNSEAVPDSVFFKTLDKKVNVIKNLSIEPAGAYLNAKNIIAEEINKAIVKFGEENWKENFKPSIQSCIELLAQYFYCRATGKVYQEYEVIKFQDDVKWLPVSQALPIARFFFLKYPNLGKQKINFWQALRMYLANKRALRNLKSLERSTL